jgi:DNA repair protein SbcD/Mre11
MIVKILHFSDAHIDMANYGRHDPETGLPQRVMDFLKSLDTIVDAAVSEKVDLVLFAGDAYKDRNPAPTFQREWGKRIMRLSRAGIPTLLLVGNHDLSPAMGRAHAVEEFHTLEVPHVRVIDKPILLTPADLEGLPLQIMALPWISRSGFMAATEMSGSSPEFVFEELGDRIGELVARWFEQIDPHLPVVFTAHCSVQGAQFGFERTVMLGADLVLPGSLVKDPRLDYVALGHIHKPQDLNENRHPPVVYPGSIERVDFGEAKDDKFYVIASVEKGKTNVDWCKIEGIRPFVDVYKSLESEENVTETLRDALINAGELKDAVVRMTIEYPRDWEDLVDEAMLREICVESFEFTLIRRTHASARVRLPEDRTIGSLSPMELFDIYLNSAHVSQDDGDKLRKLAQEVIGNRGPQL